MRATQAIAHVRSKRGIISPNYGFRRQLVAWEHQCDEAKAKAEAEEERQRKARNKRVLGIVTKWMVKARS